MTVVILRNKDSGTHDIYEHLDFGIADHDDGRFYMDEFSNLNGNSLRVRLPVNDCRGSSERFKKVRDVVNSLGFEITDVFGHNEANIAEVLERRNGKAINRIN
jgi:hypothetical protein